MITDGKKWHYLAVKSFFVLLRKITSKNNSDYYCINYLYHLEHNKNLNCMKL